MMGMQRQLDIIANNLANVSTTGYKRDELAFGDTLEMEMRAEGGNGRVLGTMSLGSPLNRPFVDYQPGQIQTTGNPYDFALPGKDAMFAVQTPEGVRYTRDGAFQLTSEGQLVTREGFPVLDDRKQPIQIPIGEFDASPDGKLLVDKQEIGQIGVFQGAYMKQGANLFVSADAEASKDPQVRWQSIEASNVNAVEAMVEMVQLQRHFEISQRSILQQDELTQRLIQSASQP